MSPEFVFPMFLLQISSDANILHFCVVHSVSIRCIIAPRLKTPVMRQQKKLAYAVIGAPKKEINLKNVYILRRVFSSSRYDRFLLGGKWKKKVVAGSR